MSGRLWLVAGAILGFLGVAAGAFGAHALKGRLTQEDLGIFEVAARYQLIHALALLGVGLLAASPAGAAGATRRAVLRLAGSAFLAGVTLFSGSLYGLALGGWRTLGAVTPLGGVALLVGWGALAVAPFLPERPASR